VIAPKRTRRKTVTHSDTGAPSNKLGVAALALAFLLGQFTTYSFGDLYAFFLALVGRG
jgi:hypothetical protein